MVEVYTLAFVLAGWHWLHLALRRLLWFVSEQFGRCSVLLQLHGGSAAGFSQLPFDVPAVVPHLLVLRVPDHKQLELAVQLGVGAGNLAQGGCQLGTQSLYFLAGGDQLLLGLVSIAGQLVGSLDILQLVLQLQPPLLLIELLQLNVKYLQQLDCQLFGVAGLD